MSTAGYVPLGAISRSIRSSSGGQREHRAPVPTRRVVRQRRWQRHEAKGLNTWQLFSRSLECGTEISKFVAAFALHLPRIWICRLSPPVATSAQGNKPFARNEIIQKERSSASGEMQHIFPLISGQTFLPKYSFRFRR
jgi:hypothetical protein